MNDVSDIKLYLGILQSIATTRLLIRNEWSSRRDLKIDKAKLMVIKYQPLTSANLGIKGTMLLSKSHMPETNFLKPNRNLINNLPNIMHFKCTKVASLKKVFEGYNVRYKWSNKSITSSF